MREFDVDSEHLEYQPKEGERFTLKQQPGRIFVSVPGIYNEVGYAHITGTNKPRACTGCVGVQSNKACTQLPNCADVVFIDDTPEAWGEYLKAKLAGESW